MANTPKHDFRCPDELWEQFKCEDVVKRYGASAILRGLMSALHHYGEVEERCLEYLDDYKDVRDL